MHQSTPFSFSDFTATAHIDFITIAKQPDFEACLEQKAYTSMRERTKFPKPPNHRKVTIHDPNKQDLQLLLNDHWSTEVLELEVSIDFEPRNNQQRQAKLEWLHGVLKTNLSPSDHPRMETPTQGKWRRKYFDLQTGTYKVDLLNTKTGNRTVIWDKRRGNEQVRLYIKGPDESWPSDIHFVRLETTLDRGGCQSGQVHCIALLPSFMKQVRQYLTPLFRVAAGIKPAKRRIRAKRPNKVESAALDAKRELESVNRAWLRYGSAWANKHDREIIAHIQANRMIGNALKGLREQLMTLKLPQEVAANPSELEKILHIYQPLTSQTVRTL